MNATEAIQIAQSTARHEQWTWIDPPQVTESRAFGLFGRRRWTVVSNVFSVGGKVQVQIDDATGSVISKEFVDWPAGLILSHEQALAKARVIADARGWPMKEPVRICLNRSKQTGHFEWEISSNSDKIGSNARIRIDDSSGEVLHEQFVRR